MRRERLLDDHAGDLVAEADGVPVGVQHARRETRVEPGRLSAEQRLEQPQLGARGLDRDGVEQRAGVVVQPRRARQHRIAHGLGDLSPARGQGLAHEERVAGRAAVQLRRIDLGRSREQRDGVETERGQHDALDGRHGQLAERHAQRMRPMQLVVAVRRDQQHGKRIDAAREQAEHVQRGPVSPVQVLEHDDRRPAAQLLGQGCDDRPGRRTLGHDRRELASGLVGDVDERPEDAGRVQRVARAREDADPAHATAERLHQRGLADAGLTGDEHQAAAPLRLERGDAVVERGELIGPLEEETDLGGGGRHGVIIAPNDHGEVSCRNAQRRSTGACVVSPTGERHPRHYAGWRRTVLGWFSGIAQAQPRSSGSNGRATSVNLSGELPRAFQRDASLAVRRVASSVRALGPLTADAAEVEPARELRPGTRQVARERPGDHLGAWLALPARSCHVDHDPTRDVARARETARESRR